MSALYDMYTLSEPHRAAVWTSFGFQLFASLVFLVTGKLTTAPKRKLFVNIATLMTAVSCLAYLIMALGDSEIKIGRGYARDFLWLHYADWAITTPLAFTVLGLLAGVSWTEVVFFVGCGLLYVAAHFAGAMSSGLNATWPLFTFGVAACLPVFYSLIVELPSRVAPAAKTTYTALTAITIITLAVYFMVWATGDGSQAQTPNQETICYVVLDIVSKVVFGFVLVFSGSALDAAKGISSEVAAKEIV